MIQPVVKNIIEWVNKNKQLAILIAGLSVLFLLVIIALFPKNDSEGLALIDQPLYFYDKKTITVNKSIYEKLKFKKSYDIYRIKSENLNIKVEGIMTQLNINAPTKVGYSNVVYQWKNKSGDNVEYNAMNQSVDFKLANRLSIFDIANPSDEEYKSLLQKFAQKYFNKDYTYSDIILEKSPSEIKISGRRLLNGIPIQTPGLFKNSDYIILDERNSFKAGKISLVSFEEKPSDKFEIVQPKDLVKLISKPTYPKEISTDVPNGLELQNNNVDVREFSDNLVDGNIPKPTSLNSKSIELVYLFSNVDQQFLTPVYRLIVEGQIVYNGSTYNVEGVVNSNAIDPAHVYIPSNITYVE